MAGIAGATLDKVGILTTFGAGTRINILETLKFEFGLRLDGSILDADGVIGMDLSISHSDANRAPVGLSLRK